MAKSPLLLPKVASFRWQQASLFPVSEHQSADFLWLAIYFPKLAIDITSEKYHHSILIVVEQLQGKTFVRRASVDAEAMGICTGMPINAAYSLCPTIEVVLYDPELQYQHLKKMATWAGQFSSKVSIYESSTLVLEVLGSIKLFGGLTRLLHMIRERLYLQWPYQARFAVTPTPMASYLLSSVSDGFNRNSPPGDVIVVRRLDELRSRLGEIRLSCLPLTKKVNKQLHRLGLRSVRDLLRLPKADIARRYGTELALYLDKLLGVLPDPQNVQIEADVFRASWALEFETRNGKIISSIVARLLQQLQQFLLQRDACLQGYDVYFEHLKKTPSILKIRFREANRDNKRFFLLFEQQFQQFDIEATVISVQLFADKIEAFTTVNQQLPFSPDALQLGSAVSFQSGLQSKEKIDTDIIALLELLQTRIDVTAINTLQVMCDHRPTYAHRFKSQIKHTFTHSNTIKNNPLSRVASHARPLWLLFTPELLTRKRGVLYYQSALTLVSGPERIESAWWTRDTVCCDYYIATSQQGATLWIYQELAKPYGWYVHGFFA